MTENIENIDTVVEEKSTKKAAVSKPTAKDDEIASLRNQVSDLTALVTKLLAGANMGSNPSTKDDVTLVYMSQSLGYIQAGNVELNCTKFRESFTLSRYDFDAIVGKYRKWFDEGILAVSSKDFKVAEAKGLKTEDDYYLTKDIMESIATCSASELEKIWNKAKSSEERHSICAFYKAHMIDGDDRFYNKEKVDLLNRLTNGGFRREVKEVYGSDLKIQPTEM